MNQDLARDGVVCVREALDADEVQRVLDVYEYGRAHPSPGAYSVYQDTGATFYIDTFNAANWDAYVPAYRDTAVPDVVADLWGSPDVWFFYEQLFLKEGDASMRRTPWHQDSSYLPVDGQHVAVVWIPLDALDEETSLEFVRGSHEGPMYNTSAFDPTDDTRPVVEGTLPRLPDIEGSRDDYDIVSFAVEPGDVVVFHANVLHGGAPTRPGQRRRTVSLRYFGDDATFAPRSAPATDPEGARASGTLADAFSSIEPGAKFRHPLFRKVRPA